MKADVHERRPGRVCQATSHNLLMELNWTLHPKIPPCCSGQWMISCSYGSNYYRDSVTCFSIKRPFKSNTDVFKYNKMFGWHNIFTFYVQALFFNAEDQIVKSTMWETWWRQGFGQKRMAAEEELPNSKSHYRLLCPELFEQWRGLNVCTRFTTTVALK